MIDAETHVEVFLNLFLRFAYVIDEAFFLVLGLLILSAMLSGLPNYQMSEYRNFGVLVNLQLQDPLFINQALRWAFNTSPPPQKHHMWSNNKVFGLGLLYMYGLVHKELVGSLYSYYDLK
jgi:hypothetical protein